MGEEKGSGTAGAAGWAGWEGNSGVKCRVCVWFLSPSPGSIWPGASGAEPLPEERGNRAAALRGAGRRLCPLPSSSGGELPGQHRLGLLPAVGKGGTAQLPWTRLAENGGILQRGGSPGRRRMREGDRDTFPGEKSCPQTLFAGGRKGGRCSPWLSPQELCGEGAWCCWGGSRSTFSLHSPTSASSAVCEPPSLPFPADSRLPAGGKGYLGLLLVQGEHRARSGQRLPPHSDTLLLPHTDFRAAAKLQEIPK